MWFIIVTVCVIIVYHFLIPSDNAWCWEIHRMDGIGWWICLQKFWKISLDLKMTHLCAEILKPSQQFGQRPLFCKNQQSESVKLLFFFRQCIFKRRILLLSLFPWYITGPALVLSRTHARDFKVKVNWAPSNPALIPHFSCGLHYVSLSINTRPHWPFLIRAVQPEKHFINVVYFGLIYIICQTFLWE